MFGTLRFLFAIAVIVTHIGGIEVVAGIAVWGFFMLSGFLMTAVLNKKYGFSNVGLVRFFASRAIRLFPGFWLVSLLSLIMVVAFRDYVDPRSISTALVVPTILRDIVANITIVGHTTFGLGRIEHALIPSAWAIDVEIWMYFVSALFLSKNIRRAKVIVLLLITFFPVFWYIAKHLIANGEVDLGGQLIYSFLPTALLPYAIGVWIWFLRDSLIARLSQINRISLVIFSSAYLVFTSLVLSRYSVTAAYVLSLPALTLLILVLSASRRRGLDDILGQLSYPMYLTHIPCAYFFVVMAQRIQLRGVYYYNLADNYYHFTFSGFFGVAALTLVISVIITFVVERPLERLRHALPARIGRK